MKPFLFSTSSLIGADVRTESGANIGVLEDIICNHSNSRYVYFIISASRPHNDEANLYVIHHSYFTLDQNGEQMTFTPSNGSKQHVHVPALPTTYDSVLVLPYQEFKVNILPYLMTAGHRSDNEQPTKN
jgi:sporulation protein YlmC with PRC-barrel domain